MYTVLYSRDEFWEQARIWMHRKEDTIFLHYQLRSEYSVTFILLLQFCIWKTDQLIPAKLAIDVPTLWDWTRWPPNCRMKRFKLILNWERLMIRSRSISVSLSRSKGGLSRTCAWSRIAGSRSEWIHPDFGSLPRKCKENFTKAFKFYFSYLRTNTIEQLTRSYFFQMTTIQ